jgi:hypothetical protein
LHVKIWGKTGEYFFGQVAFSMLSIYDLLIVTKAIEIATKRSQKNGST